jgi:hypothetical protein
MGSQLALVATPRPKRPPTSAGPLGAAAVRLLLARVDRIDDLHARSKVRAWQRDAHVTRLRAVFCRDGSHDRRALRWVPLWLRRIRSDRAYGRRLLRERAAILARLRRPDDQVDGEVVELDQVAALAGGA